MNIEEFKPFTIKADASLQSALLKIEENKYQSLIVIDDNLRVIGTISDGDIRKALIARRTLLAPVLDVMNTNYKSITKKEHAKEIFEKHFYINLIPVISELGVLQDIAYRDK